MIANRKKFIITGVVILAMIAVICIVIAYNNNETDYVFEGTFVKTEESIKVADATVDNFGELENQDEIDKRDCFKRELGDGVFV